MLCYVDVRRLEALVAVLVVGSVERRCGQEKKGEEWREEGKKLLIHGVGKKVQTFCGHCPPFRCFRAA
jgi:hypothetical protein